MCFSALITTSPPQSGQAPPPQSVDTPTGPPDVARTARMSTGGRRTARMSTGGRRRIRQPRRQTPESESGIGSPSSSDDGRDGNPARDGQQQHTPPPPPRGKSLTLTILMRNCELSSTIIGGICDPRPKYACILMRNNGGKTFTLATF